MMGLKDGARINLAKNQNSCPASSKAWNNHLNILCAVSKYTKNVYNQREREGGFYIVLCMRQYEGGRVR
jgi:hypothetical protein